VPHWIAQTYDALGPELYRLGLSIVADAGLAQDAVHQAFMRLLARGRIDDVQCARAFLRTVVRHEAYRLLQRRTPAAEGAMLEQVAKAPESAVPQEDERRQLERALRQLSAEQREVIEMKMWENMTFAQIGEVLGIPLNTAASRYRYALARLRELLPVERT
jgi:RNA polymerase sigma-70 factor, ECF subfamily